jgi:alpha-galactosidase
MGAHVSESPHAQTLRNTLLATRFNTACFGVLGYELDLKYLTRLETKEVADQIAFYKKHRRLFQFGRFDRVMSDKENQMFWQCSINERALGESADAGTEKTVAIVGFFQGVAETADGHSILRVNGLEHGKMYEVKTKPQRIFIERFGGLVKHILPIELNSDGFIMRTANKIHAMWDCAEQYTGDGKLLSRGLLLNNQFMGSHYNEQTELLGDFGSYLFIVDEVEDC